MIDYILKIETEGVSVVGLRGNHEDRYLWAISAGRLELPPRYVGFLRKLKMYHEVDELLFGSRRAKLSV